MPDRLLIAGFGQCGKAVYAAARARDYLQITATTRDAAKIPAMQDSRLELKFIILTPNWWEDSSVCAALAEFDAAVISFPPDTSNDARLAERLSPGARVVYVSSTGVYGTISGVINEHTEASPDQDNLSRLGAENIWKARGAMILRAPGIYRNSQNMLQSLQEGRYRLPGDGTNYVSRIQVDDLAQIILAALERGNAEHIYLASDEKPATHLDVVQWLCKKHNLDLPASVPLDQVHRTLRGNRQIDSSASLRKLGVKLRYPDVFAGYSQA